MRWAVFGNKGMLGMEFQTRLTQLGYSVVGFNRDNLDLSLSFKDIARVVDSADVIVNAIAYTAVDKAEAEPKLAHLVNATYAEKIAKIASELGGRYLHISTDYVFDGDALSPYKISDVPNPQTAYGKSKLAGERLVAASNSNFTILRTAWLYGQYGRCFPKTIAKAIEENGFARVVEDQIGQPTWARDVVDFAIEISKLNVVPPLVHATSSGAASWADFAEEIALSLSKPPGVVQRVSSDQYSTAAKRPRLSALDHSGSPVPGIGSWRERWHEAAKTVLNR